MSVAIQARQLGKRYGRTWALRACDLTLPAGRMVALVGPNAAGKTTLLQLAVGLLRPTEGTINIFDRSPRRDAMEVLPEIGFVAQDHPLFGTFTVAEMLDAGRKLNRRWDGSAAEARLTALGIPFDRHIGQLSGGQQAQVALSLALAKRPRVLLLDEPVAGLDPLARNHFLRALVTAAREETLTVVLSSHVLAELEQICDYLVLLNHGRIQLAAQVAAVLEQHRTLGPQIQTDPGAALIGTVPDGRRVIRVPIGESGPGQRSTLEEVVLAYLAAAPFTKEAGRTGA